MGVSRDGVKLKLRTLAWVGLFIFSNARASVKVFLLSGQSNMVGFGKISEIPAGYLSRVKNVAYYVIPNSDKTDSSKTNQIPFQFSSPIVPGNPCANLKCDADTCVERINFGPEVGIAKVLSEAYPKDKIILIKAAWSGMGLAADWLSAEKPYYPWLVSRTNGALVDIKKRFGVYTFSGVVWQQGEMDAAALIWASEYQVNLTKFIRRIRVSFGDASLPFIYGTIQNTVKRDGTKTWAYGNRVVENQTALSGIENLGCTSLTSSAKATIYLDEVPGSELAGGCTGYSLGYNIFHYNSAGQIFVGESLGRLIVERAASVSGVVRCE